jgi:hypothetical protein
MGQSAYYSVIQFCPDRSRAEAVNIGVLLLSPGHNFVDAKIARDHRRVARFFGRGSFDRTRLLLLKRAIETRIREKNDWSRGLEDLEHFIGTRANDVQLTPPRPMKTADPAADIASLFEELVGGAPQARLAVAKQEEPMFPELDAALRRPGIGNKVQFDIKVVIPVIEKTLDVPYAFTNGVVNLVKPQRFVGSGDRITREASELAIDGDLLRRHSVGRPQQLVVIPSFDVRGSASKTDAEHRVRSLLSEYDVRLVHETEITALVAEIAEHAH